MKIRAKIGFVGADFNFYYGETKEVSKELGDLLIRDGLAEEVKDQPKKPAKPPVKKKV
jgi:hypothetical protein